MKALITGASSGIGRCMAIYLDSLGYETILVARNKQALEELQGTLKNKSKIYVADLNVITDIKDLYLLTSKDDIDILINNAGFGAFGEFSKVELSKELQMIDVNIKAVHVMTKLFIRDMKKKNKGIILNVSSLASFYPGPLMATYYATKGYVTSITKAINYELKKEKSNVRVSALCPGPVDTNFNNVAGVKFSIKAMTPEYVAKYAIDRLLKGKTIIIPGFRFKVVKIISRFAPDTLIMKIAYSIQNRKRIKGDQ